MTNILLTPYDGAILGPVAKLLGSLMDGIYMFMYNVFGIENVGLSIIIFTIVIYTLMLPLTYKQQKFSKLSQAMQPEIKAIQEKYKGKRDEASQMAMNNETQMVYDKYGVSPMGSCGQILIQMPILLSLYRVFYNVPAYITSVRDKFIVIADEIMTYEGFSDIMVKLQTDYKVTTGAKFDFVVSDSNTIDQVRNYIIDVIYKVPSIDSLIKPNANGEVYFTSLESVSEIINNGVEAFHEFNFFLGLNISDNPWNIVKENISVGNYLMVIAALAIPITSYLTQVISLKLMPTANNTNDKNDMMAQQMKTMNTMMPLMSLFFCFTLPVGLGIYWIVSAAYRCVQQLVINKVIKNMSLDDIIEKNKEKAKKKQEKRGVYESQLREAAAVKTRTIESKANIGNYAEETKSELYSNVKRTYKPGSMAAKANMVKDYNEKNSRK